MKPSSERSTDKPRKATARRTTTLPVPDTPATSQRGIQRASGKKAGAMAVAFGGSRVRAHDVVMKGVLGRELIRIWESSGGLPTSAILKAIGVSERTAHRIKADPDKPLDSRTTDGIYRLESVRVIAEDVLGSAAAANEWLNTEAMGLEFRKPIDLLSTSPGAEAVKTLLQRMKYGVYA